jgi:hypothetical protein
MNGKVTFVTIHHQFDLSIWGDWGGLWRGKHCGKVCRRRQKVFPHLVDQVTSRLTISSGGDLEKGRKGKLKSISVTKLQSSRNAIQVISFSDNIFSLATSSGSRKRKKLSSCSCSEMEGERARDFHRIFNFLTLYDSVICNFLNSLWRNILT